MRKKYAETLLQVGDRVVINATGEILPVVKITPWPKGSLVKILLSDGQELPNTEVELWERKE